MSVNFNIRQLCSWSLGSPVEWVKRHVGGVWSRWSLSKSHHYTPKLCNQSRKLQLVLPRSVLAGRRCRENVWPWCWLTREKKSKFALSLLLFLALIAIHNQSQKTFGFILSLERDIRLVVVVLVVLCTSSTEAARSFNEIYELWKLCMGESWIFAIPRSSSIVFDLISLFCLGCASLSYLFTFTHVCCVLP